MSNSVVRLCFLYTNILENSLAEIVRPGKVVDVPPRAVLDGLAVPGQFQNACVVSPAVVGKPQRSFVLQNSCLDQEPRRVGPRGVVGCKVLRDVLQRQAVFVKKRQTQILQRWKVVDIQLAHHRQRSCRYVADVPAELAVCIPAVDQQERRQIDSEDVGPVLVDQAVHHVDVVLFVWRGVPDVPRL